MVFLKYINKDFKQQLETKYEVKIKFEENNNVVLTNCPNNFLPIIDKEIRDECLNKLVKTFSTQYFPGIHHATMKDSFKQELNNIKGICKKKIFLS